VKDRVATGGNSKQVNGRTGGGPLSERHGGYEFESERECERSVVHICWLGSCDGYDELMYRL
jgi:hypothetical protein